MFGFVGAPGSPVDEELHKSKLLDFAGLFCLFVDYFFKDKAENVRRVDREKLLKKKRVWKKTATITLLVYMGL